MLIGMGIAINYCFIGRVTSMVLNTLVPGKKESLKDPDNITIMLNKLLEGTCD